MAYSVNGKVYTDHPLMDEIVYNCKLILQGIVIKNDELANNYEDISFYSDVEVYMMINNGTINFSVFPFTREQLKAFGYDDRKIRAILVNKENVPIYDRDRLVSFATEYFMEHYEERNDYYRMLCGLPPYGTDEYNVYIDKSYFPLNFKKEVDFSKPIHLFDPSIIGVLQSNGAMDRIIEEHRGFHYSYLRFIGDKAIDLYTARKAGKYDILYMPSVESLVEDRFKELYTVNRDIYLKRTYSKAYAYDSEYYEQMMILMILAQTFNDMIVDVPEWYIRRDIFDIRSVQYFLESYGVAFFKEIPLKYQIRIVKNLNKLIKYKSSNKNFEDILEIFALKNTSIYKYYLYKKHITDAGGNYVSGAFDYEKYDLEFVQAKINESYDDYIKDQIYRTPYDDITYQDKYWDGEDTHQYIKDQHLARDFTIEGTKYMSIEYLISMTDYQFQMQFFLGLLMDSNVENDIRVAIPSIDSSSHFRLTDLFLFLFTLSIGFDNASTKIIRPEDVRKIENPVEKPEFTKYDDYDGGYFSSSSDSYGSLYSINGGIGNENRASYLHADGGNHPEYSEIRSVEDFYDWMKKWYPRLFVTANDRVYGFNSDVNLKDIQNVLHERHSQYQFDRGFYLSELGVEDYIVPTRITSFDQLYEIYTTNKKCYDNLKQKMLEVADDRDEFITMNWVFEMLFTKKFDYNGYKINNWKDDAEKLEEVLQDRDYVLYAVYTKIMSESNIETRKDNIRSIMNDIINTLEYYLSYDGLDHIFVFTTIASFSALIRYIYLMINFFKSYKVYFLDPFVTYVVDNAIENNARGAGDAIAEKKINYWKQDREFHRDNVYVQGSRLFEDYYTKERLKEVLDVYGRFDPDPNDDYDYDGKYPDSDTTETSFKDADGGGVDGTKNIPFIMLNGGRPQGFRWDLWDLNGAGPLEMSNYVDADGGYSEPEETKPGSYYDLAFNYILDGGSPGTNQFLSKSMYTRVVDRQIESKVRFAKLTGNLLEEKEDGLYISGNSWVEWTDFEELEDFAKDTYEYLRSKYDDIAEDVQISIGPEITNADIEQQIGNTLANMRLVVSYMDQDALENKIKAYADQKVDEIASYFETINPYDWDNF